MGCCVSKPENSYSSEDSKIKKSNLDCCSSKHGEENESLVTKSNVDFLSLDDTEKVNFTVQGDVFNQRIFENNVLLSNADMTKNKNLHANSNVGNKSIQLANQTHSRDILYQFHLPLSTYFGVEKFIF